MPIALPGTPAVDDSYTYGAKTYRWTGTYWAAIASEYTGYHGHKADIRAAIIAKGVAVPSEAPLADYDTYIAAISGGDPLTAPGAFVTGNWTAVLGDALITVNITALPSDGGSAITALQYRLNGGTWTSFVGTGTGSRDITGLTNGTPYDVEIRAINVVGNGSASDVKTRTPAAAGGAGLVTWTDHFTGSFNPTEGGTFTPTLPAGRTSEHFIVLAIHNIYSGHQAGLTPAAGWTERATETNGTGFGLPPGTAGFALYTAPGDVTNGTWALGSATGTGMNSPYSVHMASGVDLAAAIRAFAFNDAFVWGDANNMPSPTVTVEEGDGVLATLLHYQNPETFGTPASDYTRVYDSGAGAPGISELVRSNAPAGATGTITHAAEGTYEARMSYTLALAAAAAPSNIVSQLLAGSPYAFAVVPGDSAITRCYTESTGASATTLCADTDQIGTIECVPLGLYITYPSGVKPVFRTGGGQTWIEMQAGGKMFFDPGASYTGAGTMLLAFAGTRGNELGAVLAGAGDTVDTPMWYGTTRGCIEVTSGETITSFRGEGGREAADITVLDTEPFVTYTTLGELGNATKAWKVGAGVDYGETSGTWSDRGGWNSNRIFLGSRGDEATIYVGRINAAMVIRVDADSGQLADLADYLGALNGVATP